MPTFYVNDESTWQEAVAASYPSGSIDVLLTSDITLTSVTVNENLDSSRLVITTGNFFDGQGHTITLNDSITASVGLILSHIVSGGSAVIRNTRFYQPAGQITVLYNNGMIFGRGGDTYGKQYTIENCIFEIFSYPTNTSGFLFGAEAFNITLQNVVIRSLNTQTFQQSFTYLVFSQMYGTNVIQSVYCIFSGSSLTDGLIDNGAFGVIWGSCTVTDIYILCTNQTDSSVDGFIGVFNKLQNGGNLQITNCYTVFLNGTTTTYSSTNSVGLSLLYNNTTTSGYSVENYYTNFNDGTNYLVTLGNAPVTTSNVNYGYTWSTTPSFTGGTNFKTTGSVPYLLSPFTTNPFNGEIYTVYDIVAQFGSYPVPCLCRGMLLLTPSGPRPV